MFKLQRPTNSNRPSKQKDRLDFRFSNFQALQVPKGWDRLFVSLIYVETGKTIAKLGKALVKNGRCQWTETLSEPIYISRDDSSKGYEECLVKLLVSTGLTRSTILGEATINVAQYTSSRASAAVSQPLKKCSYGTILQVKIQCLTPKSKIRDEESENSKFQEKDQNVDHHDTNSKSNESDHSSDSTVGPPSEDLATTSRPLKLDSKEVSRSGSGSLQSFGSFEGSIRREKYSKNTLKSNEEHDSHTIPDHFSIEDGYQSSSISSRVHFTEDFHSEEAVARPSMSHIGSSKNLLEAAEDTIEELRVEAKMWERNARKLMIDLDISRKEFSNLSKKQADLVIELSAAHAEQDGLKRETEKLKLDLQRLRTNQATREDTIVQSESLIQMQKVLENEIKYQRELNDNLGQQLTRSQESNIELVSVLQELEETIERQIDEIENLSSLKMDFTEMQNLIARNSEDNRSLQLQLEQLHESEKKLQADVQFLEEALSDKNDELENIRKSKGLIEEDFRFKISVKEEEIAGLEEKLSGFENNVDHIREIELLKEKVQELEKDCVELTDENLELLFKLKDSNRSDMIRKCGSFDSISSEQPNVSPSDDSEVSDPKFQISEEVHNSHFTEILEQLDTAFLLLRKTGDDYLHGLNTTSTKMSAEYIVSYMGEMNKLLETRIAVTDEIIRNHELEIKERNDIIADSKRKMEESILEVEELEKSKAETEEKYGNLMKELDGKRSELDVVQANMLSNEQENELLVQRQRELEAEVSELLEALERKKHEVENTVLGLKEENMQLQECISGLEAQARQLKDENEFYMKEIDIRMQKQCLECGHLRRENQELQENHSALVTQLSESKKSLSDCTKKVELLEDRLISVLDDFALRENGLKSELDELVKETNRILAEFEALQKESEMRVQDLTDQLASSRQNHERTLKLLANYRKSEEKLKTQMNELELKLTISDYERQQLTKEMGNLKVQLQNISGFQDEISALKGELRECSIQKGKVEVALKTVSRDYEKLKGEKILFEECKKNKLAVEEKLLQMEKELTAKEILCGQNADLTNELNEVKRANMQFQQKMYRLEEERDDYFKKVKAFEEDLKLTEERNNFCKEGARSHDFHEESSLSVSVDNTTKRQFLENEASEERHANRNGGFHDESPISAEQKNYGVASKNSDMDGEVVPRERYERTKSSLVTELRELRERYLEMSLKYAEVEAEREDLVMKLKVNKGGRRWFS